MSRREQNIGTLGSFGIRPLPPSPASHLQTEGPPHSCRRRLPPRHSGNHSATGRRVPARANIRARPPCLRLPTQDRRELVRHLRSEARAGVVPRSPHPVGRRGRHRAPHQRPPRPRNHLGPAASGRPGGSHRHAAGVRHHQLRRPLRHDRGCRDPSAATHTAMFATVHAHILLTDRPDHAGRVRRHERPALPGQEPRQRAARRLGRIHTTST